jgi:hypothetical protein
MKQSVNIYVLCLLSFVLCLFLSSCEEKDERFEDNNNPVEITSIHLQRSKDDVNDRTVPFARLGQLIRLEGKGFFGVKEIYINGESAYINPTLMSDNSLIIRIPSDAPTVSAPEEVKNTIVLKKASLTYNYNFEIKAAAPSITRVSHTLPQAGDEITLYGSGLTDATSITFPGDIVVTEENIVSDEDGKWCTLTVPAGISDEGGSILFLSVNGGAYSPACFNFKKGVVHNFDDVNNFNWSGGEISADLSVVIPATANHLPKSQGKYRSLNTPGNTIAADLPKAAFYWAKQKIWSTILGDIIPLNTPTEEVGVQMDIYVEGTWNSGYIRMVIADAFGINKYCMLYAPWESLGKKVPFENPGCWYTVTFPFSDSKEFEKKTFADVLARQQISDYDQWGPWLDNDKYNSIEAEATDVVIYFDNLRVVPLETPEFSDFGDEE